MPHGTNRHTCLSPFDQLLGLQLVEASAEAVVAEISVTETLLQQHGIVHGGVYCAITETAASIGAALQADTDERLVVISHHISYFRAVSNGTLTCRATPEGSSDGDSLLWKGTIIDDSGTLAAEALINLLRRL